jgi:zinc transport system permease protein
MMVLATLFCIAFIGSGLAISYNNDLPSGPTIIVIAGITYLGATGLRQFSTRKS